MATLASLQRGSPGANDSHARRVCSPSPTTPRGWKRQLRKTLLSSLGPCASRATVKRGILRSKSSKPAGNHDRDVGALQEPAGRVSGSLANQRRFDCGPGTHQSAMSRWNWRFENETAIPDSKREAPLRFRIRQWFHRVTTRCGDGSLVLDLPSFDSIGALCTRCGRTFGTLSGNW